MVRQCELFAHLLLKFFDYKVTSDRPNDATEKQGPPSV